MILSALAELLAMAGGCGPRPCPGPSPTHEPKGAGLPTFVPISGTARMSRYVSHQHQSPIEVG